MKSFSALFPNYNTNLPKVYFSIMSGLIAGINWKFLTDGTVTLPLKSYVYELDLGFHYGGLLSNTRYLCSPLNLEQFKYCCINVSSVLFGRWSMKVYTS